MSRRTEHRLVATEVRQGDEVLLNLAVTPEDAENKQWCAVLWHGTTAMDPERYAIVVRKPDGRELATFVTHSCPVTVRR